MNRQAVLTRFGMGVIRSTYARPWPLLGGPRADQGHPRVPIHTSRAATRETIDWLAAKLREEEAFISEWHRSERSWFDDHAPDRFRRRETRTAIARRAEAPMPHRLKRGLGM